MARRVSVPHIGLVQLMNAVRWRSLCNGFAIHRVTGLGLADGPERALMFGIHPIPR